MNRVLPYGALAISIVSFCVGTSFAKQLFPMIGAEGTIAYRAGFSAVILVAFLRPWRSRLSGRDLLRIMRYGAALGLANLFFYMSLRTIPIGLAIAIEFLGPLVVALIHSRKPAHFAMVGLALAGLLLLLPSPTGQNALDPEGIAFAAAAGVAWGLYIVFAKKTAHLPGYQAVSLGMVTAALVVVPFGIHAAGATLLTPSLLVTGLAVALVSSAIPYTFEMFAIRSIPANVFGVLLSLEPVVGAIAGRALLGEVLTSLQWLAIILVMMASVGVVITTRTPKHGMPAAGA
ncbi:EamA family transporter [Roseococcus sp.]|uniref:EamA family transporter n=1 Tax=Roseococcus sp. TaxID=2109646 RepID=UPI003BAA117C